MPRSSRYGPPATEKIPGTLQRSCQEAQEMFLQAYEEAVQAYGATDEAYHIAYAALKRQLEKRGDHWIAKTESAA